ncbi:MAG: class I mannose-6-phosphate isomerase [Prevotellaceae bacterium]|jgi:mannose-6-phosphate isomerase|nr:class I mannose-6-phosphate isomerase [Prevotellaceae bacterium]
MLYPLKFKSIGKERIWGGEKLKTLFNKDFSPLQDVGESWELSDVEGDVSVVTNGFLRENTLRELIEVYMGDLVGDHVYEAFGNTFPLLIKFLDANDDLSIQVHPDNDLALKRHYSYGKTEIWYVLDAEPDAKLISGFAKPISKEEYLKHLENNTLSEVMKWHNVSKGDVFYIPAGKVHAIGKGNVILEIQQTSDVTYRIYDYNRTDSKGNTRELHTELALDAINFDFSENDKTLYGSKKNAENEIIRTPFFNINQLKIDRPLARDYYELDSFVILICTNGSAKIHCPDGEETITKGETVLIPAELTDIELVPDGTAEVIEVFV